MASKKKGTPILRCSSISFVKKPKKDMKGAMLSVTFETASGTWTQKKVFEDIWKFVQSTGKSHKKSVGKLMVNATKYRDEYLKQSKPDHVFKLMKDVINTLGKSKKILSTDSKISAFVGAKRDHLSDIKNAIKIGKKATKSSSVGAAAFDSAPSKKASKAHKKEEEKSKNDDNEDDDSDLEATESKVSAAPMSAIPKADVIKKQIMDLKQEIDTLKRKHLADISALKQENHNLKINNETLKETNAASQEARQELEEKVAKYEHELGKDQIGDDMAAIFADEFPPEEDPAEKYYQQTREQQKRIIVLEEQVQGLTRENGTLKTKVERAKYVAEHLATEVTELADPKYEQLEQDYKEVEAELDEVTKIKEEYEDQMAQTAVLLDELELEAAKMRPIAEEYPNLMKKLEAHRKEMTSVQEKLGKLQEERDDFEDKFLAIKKKDVVPMDQYKSTVKSYKERIKGIEEEKGKIEEEKQAAIKEMEEIKSQMAEIKIKLGELVADNERLEKGGGRDINLDIRMDLENDLSLFKRDEFEYPPNLSRDELILWCQHLKLLIKEINEELCSEINQLSERKETLENYIEVKGLPFPEDDADFNANKDEIQKMLHINDMPHPLPSMNFMDDLDGYNPTKKQLQEYIDLMFAEWKRDEMDSTQMITSTQHDVELLRELEEGQEIKSNAAAADKREEREKESAELKKLKKKLEAAYLKEEEIKLEHNKEIKELRDGNEALQTQLKVEQQKQKIAKDPEANKGTLAGGNNKEEDAESEDISESEHIAQEEEEALAAAASRDSMAADDEIVLLKNRLIDTEQYAKDLEDDMRQLEFESNQQKQALEREYKYQIETINIDLEESRTQCEDLERQIGSDDLNLLASEFRAEAADARNDNNVLKKQHIEEIRQLERDRDELLREINLLRIKTDRMDQNTDEAVAKMQIELDKKEKELEHSMQVASNLSQVKETMDTLSADKEELERSYQVLMQEREHEKQLFIKDIQQLNIEKKKLIIRIQTAEQDIKSLKSGKGIDSDAIITRTELVKMKEEMDNLRQKRAEAVKSKIALLQSSSLEIERMRDEIRLLTGHRKISMRDFKPGRYDSTAYNVDNRYSVSSLGSAVPLASGATHQQLLGDDDIDNVGYVSSAWNYTVGMLSSIGSTVFGDSAAAHHTKHENGRSRNKMAMNEMKKKRSYQHQHQHQQRDRYHEEDVYDIHSEYDRDDSRHSSVSRGYAHQHQHQHREAHRDPYPHHRTLSYRDRNQSYSHHPKKHSRHISAARRNLNRYQTTPHAHSMIRHDEYGHNAHESTIGSNIGSMNMNMSQEMQPIAHQRGLSAAAHSAKRNRGRSRANREINKAQQQNLHHRKVSSRAQQQKLHEKTYSNVSTHSQAMRHRQKQPSKQEILLEQTDNENIRDAMAEIFDAFEIAADNVAKGSIDITGNNMDMFSLDDMVQNDHDDDIMKQQEEEQPLAPNNENNNNQQQEAISGITDNMMNEQYFENVLNNSANNNDDFWNSNMNQEDENNINQVEYSDDDRFGPMAAMDFSGDAALHGL